MLRKVCGNSFPRICTIQKKIFWNEGFCACFGLKFALKRGEGEKREGVQISKQSTQNLSYQNVFYQCIQKFHGCSASLKTPAKEIGPLMVPPGQSRNISVKT